MSSVLLETKKIIKKNKLQDYLTEHPWMTGYLGDPNSKVWFIGENPSLRGIENVHKLQLPQTENLQWNTHDGDKLFREALTEAGFKNGKPDQNDGWRCYITNVIKKPEIVKDRNEKKSKDSNYWKEQALCWLPLLQFQINSGNPSVLVAIGKTALKILKYMKRNGLKCPPFDLIPHYSYVMFRPDRKSGLGPRHPIRIKEFYDSVNGIKQLYGTD